MKKIILAVVICILVAVPSCITYYPNGAPKTVIDAKGAVEIIGAVDNATGGE